MPSLTAMDQVTALVTRADRYARRAGLERTTVSKKLFRDWRRLDQIAEGGDISIRVLNEANSRLAKLEGDGRKRRISAG